MALTVTPAPLAGVTSSLQTESSLSFDSPDFDPSKSTQEIFTLFRGEKAAEASKDPTRHTTVFRQARMAIDASYHGVYTLPRQRLQDRIVMAIFERGGMTVGGSLGDDECPPELDALSPSPIPSSDGEADGLGTQPLAVWTAGAMGAGKGHTLRRLKQAASIFPIDAFVAIDPDEIKTILPETARYAAVDKATASGRVHVESTLIAELAERVAFLVGASVIVDGSLRDHSWYTGVFNGYRKTNPEYRLGIIHVHAEAEVVRRRAESRGRATGRFIPPVILERAIESVPKSVTILAPLVDFCVTIDNSADEGPPSFASPASAESFSRIWDGIRGHWVRRLHSERLGYAVGNTDEELPPEIEKACSRRVALANATAHAAARAMDRGEEPPNIDFRAAPKRRAELAAMPSVAGMGVPMSSTSSIHKTTSNAAAAALAAMQSTSTPGAYSRAPLAVASTVAPHTSSRSDLDAPGAPLGSTLTHVMDARIASLAGDVEATFSDWADLLEGIEGCSADDCLDPTGSEQFAPPELAVPRGRRSSGDAELAALSPAARHARHDLRAADSSGALSTIESVGTAMDDDISDAQEMLGDVGARTTMGMAETTQSAMDGIGTTADAAASPTRSQDVRRPPVLRQRAESSSASSSMMPSMAQRDSPSLTRSVSAAGVLISSSLESSAISREQWQHLRSLRAPCNPREALQRYLQFRLGEVACAEEK